jgi:predicted porin
MNAMRTRPFHLLLSAISLAVLASSPALAQSDEIDAMKRQIEMLEQQLELLKRQVEDNARKAEENASETEQVRNELPPPPQEAPKVVTSRDDNVKLVIRGQVNRGLLAIDDGQTQDVFHVDNDNSSTRLGLYGSASLNEDISAGTNFEVSFQSNSTEDISQNNERLASDNNFKRRLLELFLSSESFGKLTLGHGSTASDGSAEVDLSGTDVINYASVSDFAGGIQFRDDGNLSGTSINSAFADFDGLGRDDRARYDSPSFAGFTVSGSAVADSRYDAAVRYAAKFDETRFASALAYAYTDEFKRLSGSGSFLLPGGFNVTAAGGFDFNDGNNRDDSKYLYGKLGYQLGLTELGKTNLSADVYYGEDIDQDGDQALTYGIFAVQNINKIGTELYLGGRVYDLDRDDADFDEIFAMMTGARVKF